MSTTSRVRRWLADRIAPRDQSRTVRANMVGNAVSELPVNRARGQLTEYAAEGKLRSQRLAEIITAQVARIQVDLDAHERAARCMAEALASEYDEASQVVDALRAAGLKPHEIIADADGLAAALKKLRGGEAA